MEKEKKYGKFPAKISFLSDIYLWNYKHFYPKLKKMLSFITKKGISLIRTKIFPKNSKLYSSIIHPKQNIPQQVVFDPLALM